jgi:hypothetical protein
MTWHPDRNADIRPWIQVGEAIKSLPTDYNGITYRSRTEARWAVFFTQQEIPFRYEVEGFQMGDLRYLPDFWLPEGKCWFEVKPFDPTALEIEKATRLARGTGKMVFVAPGNPVRDIGLHAFSPTGRSQKDWCFAYAHEDGVGYIACDNWRADLAVRIRKTDASVGCYGMGPETELDAAGNHHFDSRKRSTYDDDGPGRTISVPRGRAIPRRQGRFL